MSHTENEGGENPPGEPWDLYKYYFSYPSVPKYIIDAHYLHRHSYGITFKTALLHYAVRANNADIVSELLSLGADRNAQNRKGETPKDIAQTKGYQEILAILARK